MDIVPRKRVGRPPKVAAVAQEAENENSMQAEDVAGGGEVAIIHTEYNEGALVAISPIPQSNATAVDLSADACRRSSRKKIIKFDVRDLLNKHRKPHKIQIEARIDSNATTTGADAGNASNIKEKCFIEKTSIIQRSVAFDHSQHGPTQVPIPLKTEIFKPNQGSSLIVAQMRSMSSSPNQNVQKPQKPETEIVVPKRRGRPPKNRLLIEKPKEEEEQVEKKRTEQNKTLMAEIIPKHNTQIKVQLKEPYNSLDFTEQIIKAKINNSILTETLESKDVPFSNDEFKRETTQSFEVNLEENSTEFEKEKDDRDYISVVSDIQNDKNSNCMNANVKFKEVAAEKTLVNHSMLKENLHDIRIESHTEITLPLKKQLKKYRQDMQVESNDEKSEKLLVDCSGSNIGTSPEISLTNDSIDDIDAARKTSTPTSQRSERRSGRRIGDDSNKTLEETFAEIAAKSSQAILDMAIQNEDDSSSILLQPNQAESLQLVFENSPIELDSSRSTSPKEQVSDHDVVPVKRRGRKPKSKLIVENHDSAKIEAVVEQETPFKIDFSKIETYTTEQNTIPNASAFSEELPPNLSFENLQLASQKVVETPLISSETHDDDNLILSTADVSTTKLPKQLETANKTPSLERFSKEKKSKSEDGYEEASPSTKSSSHHKHYGPDHNPKKPSGSDKKKNKIFETGGTNRDNRKHVESSKMKRSSKDKFIEDSVKKISKTPEGIKKLKISSEDGSAKKSPSVSKEKLSTESSKKTVTICPEKTADVNSSKAIFKDISFSDDKRKISNVIQSDGGEISKKSISSSKERSDIDIFNEPNLLLPEKTLSENDEKILLASKAKHSPAVNLTKEILEIETLKKSLISKEKSVDETVKKPTLSSPDKSIDTNLLKQPKTTKEKHSLDDVGNSSLNKDKLSNESSKKSKHSSEPHTKKSYLSRKERSSDGIKKLSTADERSKKSTSFSNDKNLNEKLKKVFSSSKEKSAIENKVKMDKGLNESFAFSHSSVKKKSDKKKYKHKSEEVLSTTTTKPKTIANSNVSPMTPSSSLKESSLKSSNNQDTKSHKSKKKHRESLDISTTSKSSLKAQENSSEKTNKFTDFEEENKSLINEHKDLKKLSCPERQKNLNEAFEAAVKEDEKDQEPQQQEIMKAEIASVDTTLPKIEECHSILLEIKLPPTPGESDAPDDIDNHIAKPCSHVDANVEPSEVKSTTMIESDPLYDIEKFIEAGVNLLKRDYKLAEDDEEVKMKGAQNKEVISAECPVQSVQKEIDPSSDSHPVDDVLKTIPDDEKFDLKSNSSSQEILDFYETPAHTPVSISPNITPSSSPIPTDISVDTYYYSDGARRSHRLKKITNAPKALVGRGLVRDRDRERLALRDDVETKSYYSIEDHLMDLAEVEAKNAKFLKEMEQRLSNFEVIKENEYHCERIVSREARRMVCDCFLTPEEAERGELGCGEDCLNRLLMIECSAHCKVGERCTNKRFQKYLCAPCRVFRTEKKGFGIMADVEIHPGEFIMEYVGEVLDSEEFEDRRVAYSQDKNRHYYFMALRSDAIIDATIKGNVSRFINHSCDPNAETQKWTVNGELRIGFFSRKAIMPGEEITFDYQYQRYGREAQRCYCESDNCRGWIGEEPASDEGEQIDDDDDEDDDDEYDDENDVVSMVKGLMSVEDGDDEDGKDEIMSEATRQTIQDAAVKAQLRRKQSLGISETGALSQPSLDGETDESKQKFMAYLSKISAKIELHKKNVREEKIRKRRQRKKAATERRQPKASAGRFLEDPDLEDEIDFLSRCGLKNQSDTLRFSRLMVRAKLAQTRLNLLAILRAGELPCRRLFLDYHGLHLLHGWINEDGRTDMTIRMAILETLENLPIPNKTILTESKVYQAIRGWCNNETRPSNSKSEGSSSSPSDDSSKESTTGSSVETKPSNLETEKTAEDSESPKSELEKLASRLITSWDSLPEIFRIPKRERIEQMKEHEREADRQYAATVEADSEDDRKELSTDRYQRDRFERRFGKPQGSRMISVLGGSGMGASSKRLINSDVISPEDTKHLSKEQRRELFAAKVARDEAEKRRAERRREFETKCTFFGLDPLLTRPEDIPFCVSDSGQWYNESRQLIQTPAAFAHVPAPTKIKSTNPSDYYLPTSTTKLPPDWAYAINDQGKIYYYHLKHRVPQWEPPTTEQINQTKWSDDESESDEDNNENTKALSEERIQEIEAIETQEELNVLLKKIVQEQRQVRYKRLVDQRSISPRREEDRIYNQMEMRKYKENKEKIKKRKEEIRRRRSEAIKNSMLNMCTFGSLDEKPSTSTAAAGLLLESIKTDPESPEISTDALPIQDYLLSSDEDNNEDDIDEMKAECNNSPLLDKIVQGDKIVDELDALTTKRQLKRPLPPHRDLNFDLNTSNNISAEIILSSMDKIEHKKRKQEKKDKSKRSRESSDAKYRKLKEKFRCEIAGIIVQHLKPYRKDSCVFGRIKSNEDFNHLAKKLTHFVMIKELKYCESVGQTLVVTESVKNKSREFIRKYMAKYEAGYVKPDNDPEFKEIPYTL